MDDSIIMTNLNEDNLKDTSETIKKKVKFNLRVDDEENIESQNKITTTINNTYDENIEHTEDIEESDTEHTEDIEESDTEHTEDIEESDTDNTEDVETDLEIDNEEIDTNNTNNTNISVKVTNHYFGKEEIEDTYYERIINYICSFNYPYSLYAKSLDLYHRYISYNLDANMSQITKHVYIGNISAAYHNEFLKKNNIEYIITVISDIPRINDDLISLNINIIDVPNNNIKTHFPLTNTFIETAIHEKKNILIHCVCGVSRSVTIFTAYLINKLKISPQDAITYIKSRRSIANPNKGFLIQLEEYYNMIINKDNSQNCYSSKELYNIAFRDL